MPRQVSHHRNIIFGERIPMSEVKTGNIIQFKYRNEDKDNYDQKPTVLILSKQGNIITGINISYIKEYSVVRLISESSYKKPLKFWNLYKKAFRTYIIKNIRQPKIVEYIIRAEARKPGEWWKQKYPPAPKGFVWNAKNPKGKMPKDPFSAEDEDLAIGWAKGTWTYIEPDEK